MFTSENLLWIKNVKRDQGSGWAYENYEIGDFFWLNWSSQFKGNVLKPNIGELILIFQTLNAPKGTFLTHLVSPKDNNLVFNNSLNHPYMRRVAIVAIADPISSIPKPLNLDFKKPNRGAACHIQTVIYMASKKVIDLVIIQKLLFNLFPNIEVEMDSIIKHISKSELDNEEYEEGVQKERLRRHKYYERNHFVVTEAKRRAKIENRFFCEVCNFNFETAYNPLGEGFIECHHIVPISSGGIRMTTISNLAIVCSNCHRMLHRKDIDGAFPTIERLAEIFKRNDS